jgi:predicted transcriptional regulator YheO
LILSLGEPVEDKRRLIEAVEERGLFKLRGAVSRLAEILNVSRASIYNYRGSLGKRELASESTSD